MPRGVLLLKTTAYELFMCIHGSHTHHCKGLATRGYEVPLGRGYMRTTDLPLRFSQVARLLWVKTLGCRSWVARVR